MTIALFEASLYSYIRHLEPGIAFVQARRSIPSVMVMPVGADDNRTADSFMVVRANAPKARKFYNSYPGDPDFDRIYRDIQGGRNVLDLIHHMRNFPEYFKIFPVQGKERLFKFLTTDLNMPPPTFQKYVADIPENIEEHGEKFHNAMLLFPDNVSKRSKNASLQMLEEVFDILRDHGLGFVFGCTIRFVPISGRVAGTYFYTVDEMRISPKAKRSPGVIWTLLHEFTHRLYRKFLRPEQKEEIDRKYRELRVARVYHQDEEDKAWRAKAMELFQPGMWVQYVGRKRSLQTYGPRYRIWSVDSNGKGSFAGEKDPMTVRFTMHVAGLLNPRKWKPLGVDTSSITKKSHEEIETEQWFPSKYAEKNAEEWFCELVASYLMGLLKGEPAEWVRSILG